MRLTACGTARADGLDYRPYTLRRRWPSTEFSVARLLQIRVSDRTVPFLWSLVSPAENSGCEYRCCRACRTHDCIRGNVAHGAASCICFSRKRRESRLHILPRLRQGVSAQQCCPAASCAGTDVDKRSVPILARKVVEAKRSGCFGIADCIWRICECGWDDSPSNGVGAWLACTARPADALIVGAFVIRAQCCCRSQSLFFVEL